MAEETVTKSKSISEILGDSSAYDQMVEIFADVNPALIDERAEISSLFTPQSARELLGQLTSIADLLSEEDSYEQTLQKIQGQIDKAEAIRDDLLEQVFEKIRPIERGYRQVRLYFENSKNPKAKFQRPVQLFIVNADVSRMKDVYSETLACIEYNIKQRNDNFNFRDDICNLVVPGAIPQGVRDKLEKLAETWGMLLITDIDDEKNFMNVERNFRPGGKYEFMKRNEDQAAADVALMGYLQLRPKHWFERKIDDGDDLYGPPSLAFSAAIARTDESEGIAQGPVGSRFGQISGVDKCRIEPLISEMEHMTMERQLVPIVRDANNRLCFFGCRTLADDPYGVYKFFTSYRILRYIERRCSVHLRSVQGNVLTRDFIDESVEKPLKRVLDEVAAEGAILGYKLTVDKDSMKRMQGICDISLEVMPTGPGETFVFSIDVPEFPPAEPKG